ncbi:MAG TPA: alginate export family protein [Terriglobales bacterium]|nr:alginate export family protein [Terriglobales bacterium]
MNTRTLAVAAILLIAACLHAQTAPSAGHVSAQITQVTIRRNAGKNAAQLPAVNGTDVLWGDQVRTNDSGRARIGLNDQSILSLGKSSQLTILKHDAAAQQTSLQLGYGKIRCQVSRFTRNGASFLLRTPTSAAGVIGTDFGADASVPGRTQYICISGTVRIYTPDMKSYVDCGPGKMVTVVAGQTLPTPTDSPADHSEHWTHINEPGDPLADEADSLTPMAGLPVPDSAGGGNWHGLSLHGSWRLRLEAWNWFQDGAGTQNAYAFPQSILRVNIGQQRRKLDWLVELAQPSLLALPSRSVAPAPAGQLGLGGTYLAANGGRENTASIFPYKAYVRFKRLGGRAGTQLTLGRYDFVDGTEIAPVDSTLAALKSMRIAHRLIGNFQFVVTGRSNDGVFFSSNFRRANLTVAAARPTRGVYQVDGLGELDVNWEYGALTWATGSGRSNGELRLFGLGYQDERAVAKTDNRSAAVRGGPDRLQNINIGTFGLHYIHAVQSQHAGTLDFLLWLAGQAGSWGVQQHRAGALAIEAGWQPKAAWRPWLRLGYDMGSGDGNPADHTHNTFFQVLPTPRIYARFPCWTLENMNDASAIVILRPSPKLTLRSEYHALWLASRNDLWYQGGGAFQPRTFGYVGRPANGNRGLADVWDISADYNLSPHWAFGFYYGHAWGRGVVRSIYPSGPNADFGYTELTFRF